MSYKILKKLISKIQVQNYQIKDFKNPKYKSFKNYFESPNPKYLKSMTSKFKNPKSALSNCLTKYLFIKNYLNVFNVVIKLIIK